MAGPSSGPSDTVASVALLEAVRLGASYRIEGSGDWGTKPGRLTVWLDLNSDEWDAVYDALDELYEDSRSMLSLPAEDRGQELLAPGGVEGVPPSAAHAPDAATTWEVCAVHGLSIPPGTDDCGDGETGTCATQKEALMAARLAYIAGLGASEWPAFVSKARAES